MDILLFGVTRDIVGAPTLNLPLEGNISTVGDLKALLIERYPKLEGLRSLAVAVDKEYADDKQVLTGSSEVALIPPVSGG